MEKRLQDIESALQQVQGGQNGTIQALVDPSHDNDQNGNDTGRDGSAAQPSPTVIYQGNGGIGEIDTAEDSIDGMGAIKFTDEEDWGYFGELPSQVEKCLH